MAKEIEFISERPMTGTVRRHKPAVIRVRRQSKYGRVTYYMDGLRWPVPAWMRHLDGRTVRGVVLALLVLAALGYGLARLLLAEK